jgi:pimeloyl-ACP methyl ester carboxylesterase
MRQTLAIPGIRSNTVLTRRLRFHYLEAGNPEGIPMLLVHGNTSSAAFWVPLMLELSGEYRLIAPDLSGFGATGFRAVRASTGVRDWSDDLMHFADALSLSNVVVATHSMGGIIGWDLLRRFISRIDWLIQIAPGSPFGFGGTATDCGRLVWPDGAGSGAGLGSALLGRALQAGCRDESYGTASPRYLLRHVIMKSGTESPFEDLLVDAILQTRTGSDAWPGDVATSRNWPGFAPGSSGIINALSPVYLRGLVPDTRSGGLGGPSQWQCARDGSVPVTGSSPGALPNVLWIRGSDDLLVSDESMADVAWHGKAGALTGWPGPDGYPPQPMLAQIRRYLDLYTEAGGHYTEVVIDGAGHSPHIERPAEACRIIREA